MGVYTALKEVHSWVLLSVLSAWRDCRVDGKSTSILAKDVSDHEVLSTAAFLH